MGTTIDPVPVNVNQFRAELLRRDFFEFVQYFWDIVVTDPPVWNWHIPYLCERMQMLVMGIVNGEKNPDTVINIPPGTTKSTIVSVMLPVWAWTIDPELRILTASYAASLSTDLSIKSRDILRSQEFRSLFPDVEIKADADNKTHYKNTFKGERMATSTTGSATGFHADLILIDDPLNAIMALSDAKIIEAQRFLDSTLSTRKTNKDISRTVLIMQRLSERDPTGVWLRERPDEIEHICIPGIYTPDVRPPELKKYYDKAAGLLDPVRMSVDTLKDLKKRMGGYGYAGQILQSPVPLDSAIWNPEWFKIIPRADMPEVLKYHATDWDLAYTQKEKNSASAYITAGIHNKRMYITGAGAVWKEFPQLIQFMNSVGGAHYIEGKASGKSAVQTLKANGIAAKEVKDITADKVARATLASPYAEAGLVYIADDIAEFILYDDTQGIAKFPGNVHDDLADALSQAVTRLLNKPKVIVF